jgi:threonine dehydratase
MMKTARMALFVRVMAILLNLYPLLLGILKVLLHSDSVKCVLFIPAVCNKFKLENMKQFGKEFIEFKMLDNCFENAVDQAKQYAVNNKMIFMHPFDDIDVITGYATLAAEIKEDCPTKIDYLIVPSGGGALLASMVSYFKQISPDTQIVCVEPENSNPMYQSL